MARRNYLIMCLMVFTFVASAQLTAEDFGYKHYRLPFENDTVHFIIKSKKGEDYTRKPLFFEVQGSTAVPLIVHNGKRQTNSVSLAMGYVEEKFHLVLVNKPGVPLSCHEDKLTKSKYKDPSTGQYPQTYIDNNYLEYFVRRNVFILKFLKKQSWVDSTKIVVAGHSEGSTIATNMANETEDITHLIYSGGSPYFPRILAMIRQERRLENEIENPWIEKVFAYWEDVVKHPFAHDRNKGWNTNFGTYSFSQNENDLLKKLKIPILISYGTDDECAPFNDMFHIESIKDKRKNFTFNSYINCDHYYQKAQKGSIIKINHLTPVIEDWLLWVNNN